MHVKANNMHIQIKKIDANQLSQHLCRLKENWMYSLFTLWTLKSNLRHVCTVGCTQMRDRSTHPRCRLWIGSQKSILLALCLNRYTKSRAHPLGHSLELTPYTASEPELACSLPLTSICLLTSVCVKTTTTTPLACKPYSLCLCSLSINREGELHFLSLRK